MAFKDYSREKFDYSLFLNSLFDGWKCQAAEISISGHFETIKICSMTHRKSSDISRASNQSSNRSVAKLVTIALSSLQSQFSIFFVHG